MSVLAVDVGGSHVKARCSTGNEVRRVATGAALTPHRLVTMIRTLAEGWTWDRLSIGVPAVVKHDIVVTDPVHLGAGWAGFSFADAFDRPVRVINDAAMQALGSYEGGRMLFLGLGTGLGSAIVADGVVLPLELAHLPYHKERTYEQFLGAAARKSLGAEEWEEHVWRVVTLFRAAFQPDEVVIGGGNAKRLGTMPAGVRRGDNSKAFIGGFRLWEPADGRRTQ